MLHYLMTYSVHTLDTTHSKEALLLFNIAVLYLKSQILNHASASVIRIGPVDAKLGFKMVMSPDKIYHGLRTCVGALTHTLPIQVIMQVFSLFFFLDW